MFYFKAFSRKSIKAASKPNTQFPLTIDVFHTLKTIYFDLLLFKNLTNYLIILYSRSISNSNLCIARRFKHLMIM
jgi:hypothetical protein